MITIQFNAKNVAGFQQQLAEAKIRLVKLCERQLDDRVCTFVSVARYNMARQGLKAEFPVEVIGMLDASGFINEVLSPAEKAWMKERKIQKGGKR